MSTAHRAERQRSSRFWPTGRVAVSVLLVVLTLCAVWAGTRMLSARGHLVAAEVGAETLRNAVTSGDTAAAGAALQEVQQSTDAARRSLNDPTLALASHVPLLGRNIMAPRQVAECLDAIARGTLPSLVEIASDMTPEQVMPGGGRVRLDVLEAAEPGLVEASAALDLQYRQLSRIKTGLVLPPIADGVVQARDAIGDVADGVRTGARVARLGPTLLGADGPRSYLLVFQNNAELRATGGLPGAWAEIRAEDGRISLARQGTATELQWDEPVVPITDDEEYLFTTKLVTDFRDFNFTPDWPRAAEIAAAMIKDAENLDVDGVVSVDPVAMSYIMRGVGPVQPKIGAQITADNVIDEILNGTYWKYSDPLKQDAYFAAVMTAAFEAITGPSIDAKLVGEGLSQAVAERRLLLWAEDRSLQDQLRGTAIAGETDSGASDRPQLGFYISDVSASKMDYYLSYDADVKATRCSAEGVQTFDATLTFTSSAPADAARLPDYITGGRNRAEGLEPGDLTLGLNFFAPHKGEVVSVSTRGERPDPTIAAFAPWEWQGRGVGQTTLTLSPGATKVLKVVIRSGMDSRGDADVSLTPGSKPHQRSVFAAKSAC